MLSWLLGEAAGREVRDIIVSDTQIVSSELTSIECDRALIRALHLQELPEVSVTDRRARLSAAMSRWSFLGLTAEVVERARRPFPVEPVRTLDAIHVATALHARAIMPELSVLSLDERIRAVAAAVGLDVLP